MADTRDSWEICTKRNSESEMEFVLMETPWRRVPTGQIGAWVPSSTPVLWKGTEVTGFLKPMGSRGWKEAGFKGLKAGGTCL